MNETVTSPDLEGLDEAAIDLRQRARKFVDEVLIPLEQEAELLHGRLPDEAVRMVREKALATGLTGGLHKPEHGGQGWSKVEWFLVEEQLGRSTNAISWHIPNGYNFWDLASGKHVEKWLKPLLRGETRDAYAVTERNAGSDPSGIETRAVRTDGGFRINGEKWFVTSGDVADVLVVMANLEEDGELLPTLFVVEKSLGGVETIEDPGFTHSYPDGHPTIRFVDVEVGEDDVIGGIGGGDEVQKAWFAEERLGIAARGIGSMWRLLEETVDWAANREQGGSRILDYQGV
ncbi:MAG TPA: acyl-CoA dehydrogenase family protein, partial [Solirubrobacterales bacterium]|nr:acyl-CoA dehydrogenase family protein [Solirubrobacterales bacterium]